MNGFGASKPTSSSELTSLTDENNQMERELYQLDFEATTLEALTVSCERNLRAKRQTMETKQKDLIKMQDKLRELNGGITEHLGRIFSGVTSDRGRNREHGTGAGGSCDPKQPGSREDCC
jgi:hypothetical protein